MQTRSGYISHPILNLFDWNVKQNVSARREPNYSYIYSWKSHLPHNFSMMKKGEVRQTLKEIFARRKKGQNNFCLTFFREALLHRAACDLLQDFVNQDNMILEMIFHYMTAKKILSHLQYDTTSADFSLSTPKSSLQLQPFHRKHVMFL